MGRKIVWQVFLLVAVLAALYGQQEIFAQEDAQAICEEEEKEPEEGEEQGEEQEKGPPLPYEVSYEEPDGEEQYYTVKPQVTISHPGETGETVYTVEMRRELSWREGSASREGRLSLGRRHLQRGKTGSVSGLNTRRRGRRKSCRSFMKKSCCLKLIRPLQPWICGWTEEISGISIRLV